MKQLLQIIFSTVLTITCLFPLSAQELDHVLGEVLLQPTTGTDINKLARTLQQFEGVDTDFKVIGSVVNPLNIWKASFDHNQINEYRFLNYLKRQSTIEIVQFNYLVSMRETIPDDTFFDNQWQYINDGSMGGVVNADIDADLAWDITTGGVTPQGDTIVVAIIDDGIDLTHEDFGDNLWINHAEIPDNGIDDDNNGYVDDYRGWNIFTETDDVQPGGATVADHGTPVAGIIGAQGNNGIGVTGINWDVKLMIIYNNFNTDQANVLAAYSYALSARIRYNETNGAEGAFVVATNASWGVNGGDPADAPLWCALYDTLGHAGILNCGATANIDLNVDVEGDLPTACSSDFLVAVTNINRQDLKETSAAYGAISIDLGAPGEDAYTTDLNSSYGGFGGTSSATPHVAGAIALLYSVPCTNLTEIAKASPATAALLAKQYIMDGVDPNSSLDQITVSGGRLNIFNSVELINNNCSPCLAPFALDTEDRTDINANLVWATGASANAANLRWREVGALDWNEVPNATSPFTLTNLLACTDYEFQVEADCAGGLSSGYSDSFVFKTDGCCEAPASLELLSFTTDSASITWSSVLAADSYNLLLTNSSTTISIENITSTSYDLGDLDLCTFYSVSVQTVCDGEVTNFNAPISWTTLGCGACTDIDYCASAGDDVDFEWIESFSFADLSNTSGPDDGYGDYTGLATEVMTLNSYSFTIVPGFDPNPAREYYKIWIDFNQDGTFDPEDEIVYDSDEGINTSPISGMITIPETALIGVTRLRVSMEWIGPANAEQPEPCKTLEYGEVEDYCITISEGVMTNCDRPSDLDTLNVLDNTATLIWEDATDDHVDHNVRIKKESETDWTVYDNVNSPFDVSGLEKCILYEFQVEANCVAEGTSGYTGSKMFTTSCLNSISTPIINDQVKVFPNPFYASLQIELELNEAGPSTVRLVDTKGQVIYSQQFDTASGKQVLEIKDLSQLPAGIYFLNISTNEGLSYKRVVKY